MHPESARRGAEDLSGAPDFRDGMQPVLRIARGSRMTPKTFMAGLVSITVPYSATRKDTASMKRGDAARKLPGVSLVGPQISLMKLSVLASPLAP